MQQRETTAIPRLVLSTGQRLLRRIPIEQSRLTIGRRPSNDILLDDLTVSGDHAVLNTVAGESVIRDLHSRNGTLVNGVPVVQRVLVEGDCIEIGVYRLQYVLERETGTAVDAGVAALAAGGAGPAAAGGGSASAGLAPGDPSVACLRVLSGHGAGSTIRLQRPIVSISNGAGQVAVVSRRRGGHCVTHLDGPAYPLVNGDSIGLGARPLGHLDLIELAGTILQFHAQPP